MSDQTTGRWLTAAEEAAALEWAQASVGAGHHKNCSTGTSVGCDCYFRSGRYQGARLVLALLRTAADDRQAALERVAATAASFVAEARLNGLTFGSFEARETFEALAESAAQLAVSMEAFYEGRGFAPWPNTSRMCGL